MTLKTIEQRRKTDRERLKRWRKKKLAEGNKHIQLMLTPKAHEILKREKDRTGEPYVQIINRAIIELVKGLPGISDEIEARPSREQKMIHRIRNILQKVDPFPGLGGFHVMDSPVIEYRVHIECFKDIVVCSKSVV